MANQRRHNDRTCIVTRTALAPSDPGLRFVRSPEGTLLFDLKGTLPGRGAWTVPSQEVVRQALAKKAFSRALKDELPSMDEAETTAFVLGIESALQQAALGRLGLARRAGETLTGSDTVQRKADQLGAYLFPQDARPDGVRKILGRLRSLEDNQRVEARSLPIDAQALGQAVGSEGVVHVGLLRRPTVAPILYEVDRWCRFSGWDPSAAAFIERGVA